jgi:hypothetical protein
MAKSHDNGHGVTTEQIKNYRGPLEYWLVTMQWKEVQEIPLYDENQKPIIGQTQTIQRIRLLNQTINVHPIIHCLLLQQQPGIFEPTILWATPIPKKLYDLCNAPTPIQEEMNRIVDKITKEQAELKEKIDLESSNKGS